MLRHSGVHINTPLNATAIFSGWVLTMGDMSATFRGVAQAWQDSLGPLILRQRWDRDAVLLRGFSLATEDYEQPWDEGGFPLPVDQPYPRALMNGENKITQVPATLVAPGVL